MTYTMVDTNITVLDSNELQTKYEDETKIEKDQFLCVTYETFSIFCVQLLSKIFRRLFVYPNTVY